MNDLTGFQRDLLYVISGAERPNGLDLKREVEGYYDRTIDQAVVYDNLDTLVDEGLVEKRYVDGRTNRYSLTPAGESLLESRREWENDYL